MRRLSNNEVQLSMELSVILNARLNSSQKLT